MIRQPAVAGTFYSASPDTLRADVARLCVLEATRTPAVAVISPHAGYVYSGAVAGAVFARLDIPETVILVGPNHTGHGPSISVFAEGSWLMPGAEIEVDSSLARMLIERVAGAEADVAAHRYEHSLEDQIPFLSHARQQGGSTVAAPPLRVVPVVLGTDNRQVCRTLGVALAEVVSECRVQRRSLPLLLASTDMNHYESDAITRKKDRLAIDAIQKLDADGLGDTVQDHEISMCGVAPTIAILHAARVLGATRADLIRYATSGEVSRDLERVVGYAGFIIPQQDADG